MSTRSELRSLMIAAFVLLLAVLQARGADADRRPGLPNGASAEWWSNAQRSIQLQEYGIVGHGTEVAPFHAANPAHRFEARFDAAGVRVAPTGGAGWEWKLALRGWGRSGALTAGGGAAMRADQDRVELVRGSMTEWFVNSPDGLEHGVTVPVRPEAKGDRLVIDLTIDGGLRPVFATDGKAVDFYSTGSMSVLRYGQLAVTDAGGADVPAWMEPIVGGIRLVVDDSAAIYPVTIDPVLTTAAWTFTGEAGSDQLGHSVASAGDVNKDGYADIIVSSAVHSQYTGKAYLFLGGPGGLSTKPSWTAVGENAGDQFGQSVASGDFNGDGYSDVAIGASRYLHNTVGGKVYVYLGGPYSAGLPTTPAWTAVGEGANDNFGDSVASAGDVYKEGCSDLLVGAFNNNSGTGKAYLYRGQKVQPPQPPLSATLWHPVGDAAGGHFGKVVATAGDVNNDGYSDVLVTAPNWDNSPTGNLFIGKVYLYLGSASGLSTTAVATGIGETSDNYYGQSAGTAGDVNKDGFSDIIVGAYGNGFGIGKVYIYKGSSSVTSTFFSTPWWSVLGTSSTNSLGWEVATAGDVNRDGFSDVLISAGTSVGAGKALLFLGGNPMATSPSWTTVGDPGTSNMYSDGLAAAGDVNGDGYPDVLVGDPTTNYNTGKVYVYFGGPYVAGVTFASDKSTITWAGSCSPSFYDIVRGSISDLPNFALATCLANNSANASASDPTVPSVGAGFYYLGSCDAPKDWNDHTQTGTRTIAACP